MVQDEGALDNAEQPNRQPRGRLAFRDAAFDLVINRHESFVAAEVRRVLRDGGVFVTEQAGSGAGQFHELLKLESPPDDDFHLDLAVEQLERAGLRVERSELGIATTRFADIGALAWYLRYVPCAVRDFSVERHRETLLHLHGTPVAVPSEWFWIRASA